MKYYLINLIRMLCANPLTTANNNEYAANLDQHLQKMWNSWIGKLTQTGTAAPTAVVSNNPLSAPIVWARTSAGLYTGTLAAAFPSAARTIFSIESDAVNTYSIVWTSTGVVTLTVTDTLTGAVKDAGLAGTELRIYISPV